MQNCLFAVKNMLHLLRLNNVSYNDRARKFHCPDKWFWVQDEGNLETCIYIQDKQDM